MTGHGMNHAPFLLDGLASILPVFACVGQEGDVTGAFDFAGDGALMQGAGAGLTTGADFAFVGDIAAQ